MTSIPASPTTPAQPHTDPEPEHDHGAEHEDDHLPEHETRAEHEHEPEQQRGRDTNPENPDSTAHRSPGTHSRRSRQHSSLSRLSAHRSPHPLPPHPHDEDNQARRISWAVFGAVMDRESFSRTMSDDQLPHQPPIATISSAFLRRRPSRICSPNRAMNDEPASMFDVLDAAQPTSPRPILPTIESVSSRPSSPSAEETPSKAFSTLARALLLSAIAWPLFLFDRLPNSFRVHFRVILKCSIAYFIASLFSFYDPLSDLLVLPFGLDGPFSGAHVVATIVTYYRPAATVGDMMEANHYAFWGLFWLAVIVVGSTVTSVLIPNRTISHAIILIVFVGFGYGSLAWIKLRSPGFASTCSMIIVISSVIITREGSIHFGYLDFKKSLIYTEIVMIGMLISNLTCIGFWRGSATNKLQQDLNNTLDSFSTLIGMLTKTFLLDETIYTDQEQLKRAVDHHHASFTSLKQSLNAASYEFFEPRIQRSQASYKDLVESMNRLAQHLTGLRTGCGLQYELMEAVRARPAGESDSASVRSGFSDSPDFEPIKQVFVAFCETIGPSLKTLMATGRACLLAIKSSGPAAPGDVETGGGVDHIVQMRAQLALAQLAFEDSHTVAMKKLYHTFSPASQSPSRLSLFDDALDGGRPLSQPKEEIFVICFFLFNMEEFMRELCQLLDIIADIRTDEELLVYESKLKWKRLRHRLDVRNWFKHKASRAGDIYPERRQRRKRSRLMTILPRDPKAQRAFPAANTASKRREGEQNGSLLTTSLGRLKRGIHDALEQLASPNSKTAIKVGAGAAMLTFPAFWDATRPWFHECRGQWAVVTYMIVIASTLGQTNFLVTMRVLGTLIGSSVAIIAYYLFWEDPVALPVIGFLFSIPCYWLIVSQPKFASTGRFLLLSYNLVCLYSYNVRDDNVHILVTAYRRVLSVLVGVFFGWAVNSLVWPFKARRELRKCLSEFLLESAFLYSFLVKQYATAPDGLDDGGERMGVVKRYAAVSDGLDDGERRAAAGNEDDERTPLVSPVAKAQLKGRSERTGTSGAGDDERTPLLSPVAQAQLKGRIGEFSNMELFLQVKLIRLLELLSATRHEPRLKGPFPSGRYRTMLNACQSMLDMLHSLRAVTGREEWFATIREDFLVPVRTEHREMVGNVLLYLGLLSTSIELKSPLPPYLPPAAEARVRLLGRIRTLPAVVESDNGPGIGRTNYLLFFAFAVAMRNVVRELEVIGSEAQGLFGIIGGVRSCDEFERMF